MPIYTTTIKLISGTNEDYESLSNELKKRAFIMPGDIPSGEMRNQEASVTLSTTQPNLLEVTTTVSAAASHTGKKFSFVVRREKT